MPIEPQAGESEDQYMERCISEETNAGMEQEQAVAVCANKWGEHIDREHKYDAVPPKGVQEAAAQGLKYRREYGRGGTETGIARARDLSSGTNIPAETLARMRFFFARHEQNRVPPTEETESDGGPTNGWIAWLLWGGDAGRRWAESKPESKGDAMTQAVRIDFSSAPRMRRTDEGYLTGEARVARIGIQNYRNGDGSIRRELRRPEEVFDAATLDSFKNVPVTFGHPDEMLVTADNAKRLSVGFVGENVRVDGRWVVMPLTITDRETIQRIEDGETIQLSAGYQTDVKEEAGEYDGEVYDAVQTKINGNHVAIVSEARAGEEARLQLDAADAVAVNQETTPRSDSMGDKSVTVRVDGIEYDVPPEVERHLAKQDETVESLTSERDQAKSEAEQHKAKADEAQAELDKLKSERSDEAIREAAQKRVALEREASKVLGDSAEMDGKSDRQIQEEVVKTVHSDADLTDASDDYVRARYDAALATAQAHGDAAAAQRQAAAPQTPPAEGGLESKRDEAINDIRNRFRKDKS